MPDFAGAAALPQWKLGLGTVQFGQAYGISNHSGQVPREEVRAILAEARRADVRLLDTAANYGQAEEVLASLDTSCARIVTKTIALGHGLDCVIARARQSASLLNA
ncbi:MAG: aldo/keto reductase, partial [Rhizomicrobium sp.]